MARTSKVNKLAMGNQFKLIQYVQEHFEAANLTDPEFAQQAENYLGFTVTPGNIQGIRQEFNIPSTKAKLAAQTPELMIERVEKLEQQVAKLIEVLEQLAGPL